MNSNVKIRNLVCCKYTHNLSCIDLVLTKTHGCLFKTETLFIEYLDFYKLVASLFKTKF